MGKCFVILKKTYNFSQNLTFKILKFEFFEIKMA